MMGLWDKGLSPDCFHPPSQNHGVPRLGYWHACPCASGSQSVWSCLSFSSPPCLSSPFINSIWFQSGHFRGSPRQKIQCLRKSRITLLAFHGSSISRKAHRPNPLWLFTAGTHRSRAVATFASLSFFFHLSPR